MSYFNECLQLAYLHLWKASYFLVLLTKLFSFDALAALADDTVRRLVKPTRLACEHSAI